MVPVKRGLRPTGRGRLFESSGIATLMIGLRRSTTSDLEESDTIALEHANYDGRGQALMDVGDLAVAAYDEDLRAVERRFDYGNLCVRGVAENVRGGGGITSQEPENQVTTVPCASAGAGAETQSEPPGSPQELSDAARALVALLYRPARRTGLILPEMALNSDQAYPAFCLVGPRVYSGKS